jgi:transposase
MALKVRPLTAEERTELQRRAQSRTEAARVVERARIVWAVHQGERVPAVARRLSLGTDVVRKWVRRFNDEGVPGLADRPRSGRPVTYSTEQVVQVLATAVTDPKGLGLPFGCWTLDRLTTYLHERPAEAGGPLPISRSQLDRLLAGEGLRWRKEETWFGERVDPQFAEKRGPSSSSAPRRRPPVWSSTSTKWGRRAPRAIPA